MLNFAALLAIFVTLSSFSTSALASNPCLTLLSNAIESGPHLNDLGIEFQTIYDKTKISSTSEERNTAIAELERLDSKIVNKVNVLRNAYLTATTEYKSEFSLLARLNPFNRRHKVLREKLLLIDFTLLRLNNLRNNITELKRLINKSQPESPVNLPATSNANSSNDDFWFWYMLSSSTNSINSPSQAPEQHRENSEDERHRDDSGSSSWWGSSSHDDRSHSHDTGSSSSDSYDSGGYDSGSYDSGGGGSFD